MEREGALPWVLRESDVHRVRSVAPDDTTTLFLRIYAENQAAEARCWIDDLFIDRKRVIAQLTTMSQVTSPFYPGAILL